MVPDSYLQDCIHPSHFKGYEPVVSRAVQVKMDSYERNCADIEHIFATIAKHHKHNPLDPEV
jgi:hypothetical protein